MRLSSFRFLVIATPLVGLSLFAACGSTPDERTSADSSAVSAANRTAGEAGARSTAAPLTLTEQDVVTASATFVSDAIILSGPLVPSDVVVMRAQVQGTVANLRVDRGTPVRAGQRLATIRAAGVVSQAAGATAAVAAAEANVAVARKQREAARTLFGAGAMSELEKQSAEASFTSAEAQLAAARSQATAASEAAGYTTVTSPINGVISDRKVQDGESVKSGDELLTIVNSATLELSGQVGVVDAARVRVGQAVSFSLDALPSEQFTGRVVRIDPVADAGTRQVGVYVALPNRAGRIVGGQFARGRIALGTTSAITVPQTAVLTSAQSAAADSSWVFVVENGTLTRRPITLGARDDAAGVVAVTTGLTRGDVVLRTLTPDIRTGTRVELLSKGASGPSARKEEQP